MKALPIFIENSPWLEILESDMASPGKLSLSRTSRNIYPPGNGRARENWNGRRKDAEKSRAR